MYNRFSLLLLLLLFKFSSQHECDPGVFDVKIFIDDESPVEAEFNAKLLKLPTGDSLRGWQFSVSSSIEDSLISSLFIESEDKESYYLAYRSLTTVFEGNSIEGQGKSIRVTYSADLKSGKAETHSIIVLFRYDPDWSVISDEDFNRVLAWLNSNRVQRINYVTDLKRQIAAVASDYVSNATNSELSGKSQEEVQEKIKELKEKIESLQEKALKLRDKYNETLSKIAENENKIQKLKKELSDTQGSLSQLNGQLSSQKTFMNELVKSKETNTFNKERFSISSKNALDSIRGLINAYQPEAAGDGWYLDLAFKDLQSLKDLNRFQTLVKKALLP